MCDDFGWAMTATTLAIEQVRVALRKPLPGLKAQMTMAPPLRLFDPPGRRRTTTGLASCYSSTPSAMRCICR